jgi:hypothetical protein
VSADEKGTSGASLEFPENFARRIVAQARFEQRRRRVTAYAGVTALISLLCGLWLTSSRQQHQEALGEQSTPVVRPWGPSARLAGDGLEGEGSDGLGAGDRERSPVD